MKPITFTIPLRTTTGLNAREHYRARAERVRLEHLATLAEFPFRAKVRFPCVVELVRISPGQTPDDDGVVGGLKAVRDCIAKRLGVDDGQRHLVRFLYDSEKGPWGVRVTITSGVVPRTVLEPVQL